MLGVLKTQKAFCQILSEEEGSYVERLVCPNFMVHCPGSGFCRYVLAGCVHCRAI